MIEGVVVLALDEDASVIRPLGILMPPDLSRAADSAVELGMLATLGGVEKNDAPLMGEVCSESEVSESDSDSDSAEEDDESEEVVYEEEDPLDVRLIMLGRMRSGALVLEGLSFSFSGQRV